MNKLRKSNTWKEMRQTPQIVRNFNFEAAQGLHKALMRHKAVHIVGLGSSTRFPAQNIAHIAEYNDKTAALKIKPMGGREALGKKHGHAAVFLISNSGETKEVLDVARKLKKQGHSDIFAITAGKDSTLAKLCGTQNTVVLSCGKEEAIAATKSVVEQALVMMMALNPAAFTKQKMQDLAAHIDDILGMKIPKQLIKQMNRAHGIHFSAPPNGAVHELVLKFTEACTRRTVTHNNTTEIVHGPVQGMVARKHLRDKEKNKDVVILIDPDQEDIPMYREKLVDRAGLNVWTMNAEHHGLDHINIPEFPDHDFRGFTQLIAGWAIMIKLAQKMGLSVEEVDRPDLLTKVAYTEAKPH